MLKNGADPNIADNDGVAPLNKRRETPLDVAQKEEKREAVDLLVAHGGKYGKDIPRKKKPRAKKSGRRA